jgi:UDP-N-acetylglucosamine--N-acetylmuramyl-(pentapeptide) pyrophosphoryl-undecaprenol N-acetylglucosamine transferase
MKSKGKTRLMVVAGGSGGHIFPAIGFCQDFIEKNAQVADVTFVTNATRQIGSVIPGDFKTIFLRTSRTPLGILYLIFVSLARIFSARPDVVFGFGGYFSAPFLVWAKLLGKKTLIHEQNVMPGKANKYLCFWADKIVISFPGSKEHLKPYHKKVFLAQFPLRKSLKKISRQEALQFFDLEDHLFTVLVIGGSQGAQRLNEKLMESLRGNANLDRMQFIHLAGASDKNTVEAVYRDLMVSSKVLSFLADMSPAYSAADLVIGRSGAGCVAEIMRFGLPSVLVPYPYAGGHQAQNARFLAERGAAILLEEEKFTPAILNGLLDILREDVMRRKTMAHIASGLYEASQNLTLCDVMRST